MVGIHASLAVVRLNAVEAHSTAVEAHSTAVGARMFVLGSHFDMMMLDARPESVQQEVEQAQRYGPKSLDDEWDNRGSRVPIRTIGREGDELG